MHFPRIVGPYCSRSSTEGGKTASEASGEPAPRISHSKDTKSTLKLHNPPLKCFQHTYLEKLLQAQRVSVLSRQVKSIPPYKQKQTFQVCVKN